ncbi:hypothetical protein L6R53_21350 [Myxococcota bacterium]|nr:hypothetical protein [Myxococcota bacterium]
MPQPLARQVPAQVPHLQLSPDGAVHVVRWGRVLGTLLRPGDLLVPGPTDARVVVLTPRGRGRPMLAVREGRRLLALPGMVPVSPERWSVASGVLAVERDLERGAPDDAPMHVASRVRGTGAGAPSMDQAHGWLEPREIDGLCIRGSVAPRRSGQQVSIAAAPTPHQALSLLDGTPAGRLRFALAAPVEVSSRGQVIPGPWCAAPPPASTGQVPLPFLADTRRSA